MKKIFLFLLLIFRFCFSMDQEFNLIDVFGFSDSDSSELDISLGFSIDFLESHVINDDLHYVEKFFLKNKDFNINIQDKDGNTPLHWACQVDSLRIVKFFIKNGADIKIKNKDGNSAFDEAFVSYSKKVVKYFIENKIDINSIKNILRFIENKIYKKIQEDDFFGLKFYISIGIPIKSEYVRYALKLDKINIYRLLKVNYSVPIFYFYSTLDKSYWL